MTASMMPGMSAPANNSPTDTGMNCASTINTRLGGTSWARVPEAVMTPVASLWSYLYRTITGSDSRPITITVAATTPVAAASNVPTNTTATATPPRSGPISMPMVVSRRSASPDFSNTAPMNTKNGMAKNVRFDTESENHFENSPLSTPASTDSVNHPSTKKRIAVPANENATG